MSLPHYITTASDLVTPTSEIRAGFIRMALEKNERATPHLRAAAALRARAIHLGTAAALITDMEARDALLSAAGLSAKALQHLTPEDKTAAIAEFVGKYLEPAGADYPNELTYRFLLTRGDALGGEMRNIAGRLGDVRFLGAVLGAISIRNWPAQWRHKDSKRWAQVNNPDEAARNGSGLSWIRNDGQERTLLLNVRVPLVAKNVDSALLSCAGERAFAKTDPYVANPHFYVALGELKAGIDPAGADEHWKTANHTISRIGQAFAGAGRNPKRYFVGAAIATSMSDEIFSQLNSGQLSYAANLTNDDQLASFCEWLIEL